MSTRLIFVVISTITLLLSVMEVTGQELIKLNVGIKDTVRGIPAPNITCKLYEEKKDPLEITCNNNGNHFIWKFLSQVDTDVTGRAFFPLTADKFLTGNYRVSCQVDSYFTCGTSFYNVVVTTFTKFTDANDPILLNFVLAPTGYTVYRGSAVH